MTMNAADAALRGSAPLSLADWRLAAALAAMHCAIITGVRGYHARWKSAQMEKFK